MDGDLVEPRVSVIIPNLNGAEILPSCLRSLKNQGIALEVILIDNGSMDNSILITKSCWPETFIISNDSNRGFAEACVQGAAAAHGDLLLFLNTDVELAEHTVDVLVSELGGHPEVGACQPTMRSALGRLDSAGSLFTKTGFLHHITEDELTADLSSSLRFSLKGACLLVRRSAYEAVGGFDPSYFAYFEETDLCWRMQIAGWHLLYVPKANVLHLAGSTTTKTFSSSYIDYLSFRNRITTIRKNTETRLRWKILPVHLLLCSAVAVMFLLHRKPRNAAAIVRAILWHLFHGSDVAHAREHVRRIRHKSDGCIEQVTVRTPWAGSLRQLRSYLIRW
jgi:GT2 family glycosyltransferase